MIDFFDDWMRSIVLLGLRWVLKKLGKGLRIPGGWVDVKLANSCVGELLGRPPGILDWLQKRSRADEDILRHFVYAWLTSHTNWHV